MCEIQVAPVEQKLPSRGTVHDVFEGTECVFWNSLERVRVAGKAKRQEIAIKGLVEPGAGGRNPFLSSEQILPVSSRARDLADVLGAYDAPIQQESKKKSTTSERNGIVSLDPALDQSIDCIVQEPEQQPVNIALVSMFAYEGEAQTLKRGGRASFAFLNSL
jgi:hypothetical protein